MIASFQLLSRESIARGLEGIEWAVDVPGTVGGAVVCNAGAYGGYICDSLRSLSVLEPDGTLHEMGAESVGFCYRDSKFKQQPRAERTIVLSVILALRPGDQLVLVAETLRLGRRGAQCRCKAMVKDAVVAEAQIKFMLVDEDKV